MIAIKELLNIAIKASYEAGSVILDIYRTDDFDIEMKSDNSPLSKADKLSHQKIEQLLQVSNLPILSEEGRNIPYDERKNWEYFWMVDPLDGTKEFIKKNDEFTVNIALIHKGKAILGVVYAPVLDIMYYGSIEGGTYKIINNSAPVMLKMQQTKTVKAIVASRSHLSNETQNFINLYPNTEVISMGSSLKFMLIVENKAQLYPRFSPTMEWDTAAAQAIVESAGGKVVTYPNRKPMLYNKKDLHNDWFLVY